MHIPQLTVGRARLHARLLKSLFSTPRITLLCSIPAGPIKTQLLLLILMISRAIMSARLLDRLEM